MAKPGDIVRLGTSWCLIYETAEGELHNIILTDNFVVCKEGSITGELLRMERVMFSLTDLLERIKNERS